MLLLARDEDGNPMTDRELRDELVTLLVAGHETTSAGLAWAFELLMRNPARAREARGELAAGDRAYLDAVVKETLRIRPVISGVGRVVRGEPFQLGGYSLPPGIEINPTIGAIHRRGDRYPDPDEFRPERFLDGDAPDTYTWLPFGGGTRRCLGASFATFEMAVVIARVLERADLEAVGRRPEQGIRRGVTFSPKATGARAPAAGAGSRLGGRLSHHQPEALKQPGHALGVQLQPVAPAQRAQRLGVGLCRAAQVRPARRRTARSPPGR